MARSGDALNSIDGSSALVMATPVFELPNELMLEIFDEVRRTSTTPNSDLLSCMRCCHDWNDLIINILYEHVSLLYRLKAVSAVPLFLKSSKYDQTTSLNLTIHPTLLSGFRIEHKNAFKSLDGLLNVLPGMKRLETFSLTMDSELDRTQFQHIPGSVISKLVLALPASVVNLELDSRGAEANRHGSGSAQTTSHDICDAVAQLFPRLHTLALGLDHICEMILGAFNDAIGGTETSGKPIKTSNQTTIFPLRHALLYPYRNYPSGTPPPRSYCPADVLAKKASSFCHLHQFPHLQSFIVIQRQLAEYTPHPDRDLFWHMWIIRNLISNTTSLIPYNEVNVTGCNPLFTVRDTSGNDHLLSRSDLHTAMAGGQCPWTTGHSGVRVPPEFGNTAQRAKIGVEARVPHGAIRRISDLDLGNGKKIRLRAALDRETAEAEVGASMGTWEWEATTRCPLLKAHCTPGLMDKVRCLAVTLPPGWEWQWDQHADDGPKRKPVFTG
ncbi:hypothetical protein BU16DRAFT_568101 [Lophium mytilinum]|uniref:F-box domain-containing protein n=1 Tax=Lophium mytilinum TaxID=390894 RepID=A0A6A6QAC7_9PEZI|nr:hypothetical protein BU16DRAFT_568101 [Lophium mytilinum]